MNNHPTFTPNAPIDSVQVAAFATADQNGFQHLKENLGLSLSAVQFGYIQHHYRTREKKNPSLGELILLDALIQKTPTAQKVACGELYCDSDILMETWSDIMQAQSEIYGETTPATLYDILSLPKTQLLRRRMLSAQEVLPFFTPANAAEEARPGVSPQYAVNEQDTPDQRWFWHMAKSTPTSRPPKKSGDILFVIPHAKIRDVLAFLQNHPLGASVIDYRLVSDTSLLTAALSLCQDEGLYIQLDHCVTQVPSHRHSRIRLFVETCEASCRQGYCHAVLRIPAGMQNQMFITLANHGLIGHIYGSVAKNHRLVIMDKGLCVVSLMADFAASPAYPTLSSYVLPNPAPLTQHALTPPTRTYLGHAGLMLTSTNLSISQANGDGFGSAVQSVLWAVGELATCGIPYSHVHLSPVITYRGDKNAPVLLSLVCGLYRVACELGVPVEHFSLDIQPTNENETDTLHMSLYAYAPVADPSVLDKLPSQALDKANLPLTLLTCPSQEIGDFDNIRGLLSYVAGTVRTPTEDNALHTLTGLYGTALSGLKYAQGAAVAGFYDSHRNLLQNPLLLGFMAASDTPLKGYHVGETMTRPEGQSFTSSQPVSLGMTPITYPDLTYLCQKEFQRRKEKNAMEKMKAFESLSKRPRPVILDTDIGPDCDDVGALATLIHYAKQYKFPILGVCNCTSMKAGNGIIDAVCHRCGIDTPAMGQWSGAEFMNIPEYHKYNDAVAEKFSEGYRNGTLNVTDEVTFYRTLLANAKDSEVMVISIGMFNNLAALLQSPADDISPLTGVELVKAKVYALVSMAAILPEGRECNVHCDSVSAKEVFDNWPTPIYFSDFYIGLTIKTGYGHITDPDAIHADPLVMSYHYYTKDWQVHGDNASYDLTAVQFAALGDGELYGLVDMPGRLEFYAHPDHPDKADATRFIPDPMGNRIFITKKVSDEVIAQSLNDILHNI